MDKETVIKNVSSGSATALAAFFTMQMIKKVDPRIRSLIVGTAGAGVLAAGVLGYENEYQKGIGLGLMLAALVDTANSVRGAYIVENKYNKTIYYKPESGTEPVKLEAGQTPGMFTVVDGFTSAYKPGHIYKIPTACIGVITENGDFELKGAISKYINSTRTANQKAGWYDRSWEYAGSGWQKLFDKSDIL